MKIKKFKRLIDAYSNAMMEILNWSYDVYRDVNSVFYGVLPLASTPLTEGLELKLDASNDVTHLYFTNPKWMTREGKPITIQVFLDKKEIKWARDNADPDPRKIPQVVKNLILENLEVMCDNIDFIERSLQEKLDIRRNSELCKEFGLEGEFSYYKLKEN
jgi:hypothetical protein